MIRGEPQPEPAQFQALVRQKGLWFLETCPRPTTKQWSKNCYWREILGVLHDCYGGICAYSCHWIPYDTGADTVEHFLPKSKYPEHAYEWSNYRLVCATLNGRKGSYEDVLDPFTIRNGWFVLRFPALLVKPADGLDPTVRVQVQATIKRLKLNDQGTCVKARADWINDYCTDPPIPFDHLRKKAPFIASELERQGLVDEIRRMWSKADLHMTTGF